MRESAILPLKRGVVIAYRTRIACFDVISRQGPPKASHFSWASSVSGSAVARTSLKATTSAVAAPQSRKRRRRSKYYGPRTVGQDTAQHLHGFVREDILLVTATVLCELGKTHEPSAQKDADVKEPTNLSAQCTERVVACFVGIQGVFDGTLEDLDTWVRPEHPRLHKRRNG